MPKNKIKVVILSGGMGHRFRDHIKEIPKPLINIGKKPILWHIMKYYEYYGFTDFVLCLGFMADKIKDYFEGHTSWNITFAYTGLNTNTGGRIKKIENLIKDETFFVTYGDGLSDINLNKLLEFHRGKNKIATITCVRPNSPFGIVNITGNNLVASFDEKPLLKQWINGGFFVFNREIFKYLGRNDVLEKRPFEKLAKDEELAAYRFRGFWECMDTYKDHLVLNEIWSGGNARWAKWRKRGKL